MKIQFSSRSLLATVNKKWKEDNDIHLKYYSLDLTNFDSQWVAHQTNIKKCAGMIKIGK